MNNLGTFWNEIRQNVEKNQNEISNDKNFYTKSLTKLIDSEKFWMEILRAEKWKCPGILVLHQNVDVPTELYSKMNTLGTFPMKLAENLRKLEMKHSMPKMYTPNPLLNCSTLARF